MTETDSDKMTEIDSRYLNLNPDEFMANIYTEIDKEIKKYLSNKSVDHIQKRIISQILDCVRYYEQESGSIVLGYFFYDPRIPQPFGIAISEIQQYVSEIEDICYFEVMFNNSESYNIEDLKKVFQNYLTYNSKKERTYLYDVIYNIQNIILYIQENILDWERNWNLNVDNLKGLIEDKFNQLIGKNLKHTESFDKKEKKTNMKLDTSNFSSELNSIKKLLTEQGKKIKEQDYKIKEQNKLIMKQDEIINQQLSSSQVASESSNYSELRADIQKLGQIVSTVARKTASTYNEFTENKKEVTSQISGISFMCGQQFLKSEKDMKLKVDESLLSVEEKKKELANVINEKKK